MSVYAVNVTSKFDFFLDADLLEKDPEDLLKEIENEKKKEKEEKTAAKKEAAKNPKKTVKSVSNKEAEKKVAQKDAKQQQQQNVISKENRGPRGNSGAKTGTQSERPPRLQRNQPRGDAPMMENGEDSANGFKTYGGRSQPRGGFHGGPRLEGSEFGNSMADDRGGNERGRGRGRGGFRGTRGGMMPRGGGRGRDFERHSGSDKTGVKPIEKKEGGGSHNWGTIKDDMEAILEPNAVAPEGEVARERQGEEAPAEDVAVPVELAKEGGEEKKEEEKPVYTLEEYRKLREAARDATRRQEPTGPRRKPNEGEDNAFNNMVAYRKPKNPDSEESDEDEEFIEEPRKQMVDIKIRFNDPAERRRSRGRGDGRGRGEGRGRGRFEGRGGGNRDIRYDNEGGAAAPRLDNEMDFPSLK